MESWIIDIMNQFGYIGIVLLIMIENLFPPIPSEVILTFGGFMTTYTNLSVLGIIIASTVGAFLGAIILYYVGKLLSPERIEKILSGKIGKILHFKKSDVDKACVWFNKRGKSTVLFCRCIPILRSLISIPAGISKMNMSSFCLMTLIGTIVWNTVLVLLGVIVGSSWKNIVSGIDIYKNIILIALLIGAIIAAIIIIKKKKRNN